MGRFARAFDRLLGAFGRYQAAPRDPERVPELAAARAELDDARADARAEAATDWEQPRPAHRFEPGVGTDSNSVAGRIAAGVFLVIVLLALFGVWRWLGPLGEGRLTFVDGTFTEELVVEEGRCAWRVDAEVRNNGAEPISVRNVSASTRLGLARGNGGGVELPQGTATPVRIDLVLPECPDALDDLAAGNLRVNGEYTLRR